MLPEAYSEWHVTKACSVIPDGAFAFRCSTVHTVFGQYFCSFFMYDVQRHAKGRAVFPFFSEFIIFSTDVWIIMWGSRDAETNYVHEFTSMWELVVWMISSLLFRQSSAKYRKLITAQNGVWETWLINIYVLWYTQTLPIKFGRKQKLYIWKITNFGSYFKRMIW